ncbi:hypothetical protein K439DRAFT_1623232 [Ramaria rubella]|nr:hypothetical protein K439DRAFT_1623232 [Ramaria rubella]
MTSLDIPIDPRLANMDFAMQVSSSRINFPMTPVGAHHRTREESLTPRQRKWRMEGVVITAADAYHLCHRDVKKLEEFSMHDTHAMLITIQVHLMKLTSMITVTQTGGFVESATFKNKVVPMLKAALLSPSVFAYVDGLGTYIIKAMKNSLKSWKIPPNLFEDKPTLKKFQSHIRKVLTDFCSHMKKTKMYIWDLAVNLASKEYILSEAHYLHFALLRVILVGYNAANMPGEKHDTFWSEVDCCLANLCRMSDGQNELRRWQLMLEILTTAYNEDRIAYPGGFNSRPSKSNGQEPHWQKDMDHILTKYNEGKDKDEDEDNDEEEQDEQEQDEQDEGDSV